MEGEYDEGYESKTSSEQKQQQEEDEEEQFNTPDRFEDAEDNLDDREAQQQPEPERRRSTWEPPTKEQDFSKIPDEQKPNLFLKTSGLEITKDLDPELFERTEFIRRKNSMTIQRIEYNGEKIYFIERGELKAYARETGKQSRARREFDEKLGAVRDAINDDIFRNELEVDRRLNIANLDEAEQFLMDANESFYRDSDNAKVREKLEEVEQKIQELQEKEDLTEEEQALLDKYKNISDNIRVNLLRERSKYTKFRTRNNILVNLERLREWLRSRFPLIAGLVAFTAGVFSIIFAVVKLTKGAAVATAKAAHSTGKTIAQFLAKLGPIAAAIGSFVISLLSYLSQGVLWLANNLWILLLALLGFLYNEYKSRK